MHLRHLSFVFLSHFFCVAMALSLMIRCTATVWRRNKDDDSSGRQAGKSVNFMPEKFVADFLLLPSLHMFALSFTSNKWKRKYFEISFKLFYFFVQENLKKKCFFLLQTEFRVLLIALVFRGNKTKFFVSL